MSSNESKSVRDVFPIRDFLTFRFARVHARLNAQASRILRETADITLTQWRIIALIGASSSPIRLSDIAREGLIDKGLLSRNMKAMIEAGLVLGVQNENDHRAQFLTLTAKGRELFDQTLPIMQRRQAHLRSPLSQEEYDTLFKAFSKLEAAANKTDF